eukprot:3191657-Amphidinium_carterae.1
MAWMKPKYVELDSIITEDGSTIKVYKWTQTIDGVWKHFRAGICQNGGNRPAQIQTLLRTAQWRVWVGADDAWVALGKTLP